MRGGAFIYEDPLRNSAELGSKRRVMGGSAGACLPWRQWMAAENRFYGQLQEVAWRSLNLDHSKVHR